MPRRPRRATGQFVFHVLNRAIQDLVLFENASDYEAFLRILTESAERIPMRLLAYAVMPNHWHLVMWPPSDDGLSPFMKSLTARHAQQWRLMKGNRGRGAVYQGRFKAIAVQHDIHFLRLCRYVERNPLRAKLVARAEDWPWSSASATACSPNRPTLAPWPLSRPHDWTDQVNTPEPPHLLKRIRTAIQTGRHLGTDSWRATTARQLRWRTGRPETAGLDERHGARPVWDYPTVL